MRPYFHDAGSIPEDVFRVSRGRVEIPDGSLLDQRLEPRAAPDRLKLRVGAATGCDGSSEKVLSPDGRYALFNVHPRWNLPPEIDLFDRETGEVRLFRASACDPAWAADGRIAYLKFSRYLPSLKARGSLEVQTGLTGTPTRWSTGKATPIAWAGASLLTISTSRPARGPGRFKLRIRSGPNDARRVTGIFGGNPPRDFSLERVQVDAISPDGAEALLSLETPDARGYLGLRLGLLRIDDGHVVSQLQIRHPTDGVEDDGDWHGDTVVLTEAYCCGGSTHPAVALTALTTRDDQLSLRFRREFLFDGELVAGQAMPDGYQPRFTPDGKSVRLWINRLIPLGSAYLTCGLSTRHCLARPLDGDSAYFQGAFVSNPSRP